MKFKTQDSALAYFVNQLENLDKALYMPLSLVSWSRDIMLRPGISMSQESTSFIQSTLAGPGTLKNGDSQAGGNMPWISPTTTGIPGVSVDGQKLVKPLRPLAREISFTSIQLERSQLLQQPIDVQQTNALNLMYQMNTDQMVYVGSSDVGATGLLNEASVTASNVPNGAGGSPLWVNKTPDEILDDVNALLTATWQASGFAQCPSDLRLPPKQYALLAERKVSSAGNVSIMKFLEDNSIALRINGKALNIQPIKWLPGLGAGSTDRMMAYTNALDRVRFPMVPIRRETAYYQGIRYAAPYVWAFGEVEFVYPETVQYADGI